MEYPKFANAKQFQLPPSTQEAVDSVSYRDWFAQITKRLNEAGYLLDPYPDRINVDGTYEGVGQISARQRCSSGLAQAAGSFQSFSVSPLATGSVIGVFSGATHETGVAGGSAPFVMSLVGEAWLGLETKEPTAEAGFSNMLSIVSQYHDNNAYKFGLSLLFFDRAASLSSGAVLHGTSGNNKFNRYSTALYISSQARSTAGEYCGWNTGIYFTDSSIDRTIDGLGTVIDFSQVPSSRLASGIVMGADHWLHLEGTRTIGVKYESAATRVGIYNGTTPLVHVDTGTGAFTASDNILMTEDKWLWLEGSNTYGIRYDATLTQAGIFVGGASALTVDGSGKIFVVANTAAGATAGGGTLPAAPAAFLIMNIGGTDVKIPYYNV